jgi:flagellar protein FliO/FliZ
MTLPSLLRPFGAAVLGCLLTAPVALAASGEQTPLHLPDSSSTPQASSSPGPNSGSIVRTIVGLAVVIGVIYGLTWVLKQVKKSKASAATGSGLETLATLPLGTNRTLHLVRAGGEIVLIGAGEGGVTPIRTYSESEARELGLIASFPEFDLVTGEGSRPLGDNSQRSQPAGRSFVELLRSRTVIK